MSRIKTRKNAKDVKLLDKSAAVGQRMKNAFVRSRRDAAALADDRQASPNEYAGDKVEYAADELIHDTANVAVFGTKSAGRQGRKLFQRQREKKAEEKRKEGADSPDNRSDTDSQGHPLRQGADNASDEQPPHQRTGNALDEQLPQ